MKMFIVGLLAIVMCFGIGGCANVADEDRQQSIETAEISETPETLETAPKPIETSNGSQNTTPTKADLKKYDDIMAKLSDYSKTEDEILKSLEPEMGMTTAEMKDFLNWVMPYATGLIPLADESSVQRNVTSTSGAIEGSEKIEYYTYAQTIIKNNLSAPNTAKFPASKDDYKVVKTGNRYKVESWVEAENKLGGKVKDNFVVIYEMEDDGKHFVAKYIQIGSTVVLDD